MSQICTTELLSERVVRNDLLLVNDFKNFEMELTKSRTLDCQSIRKMPIFHSGQISQIMKSLFHPKKSCG